MSEGRGCVTKLGRREVARVGNLEDVKRTGEARG